MRKISTLAFLLVLTGFNCFSQEFRKGEVITCYKSDIINPGYKYIPPPSSFYNKHANGRTALGSDINVFYSGFPQDAQDAVQFAVDIWASIINSSIKIEITATWTPLGSGGILANANSTDEVANFEGAPVKDFFYPIALAEKLARKELNGSGESEIRINVNSDRSDWYFGTDGSPGTGQIDLVTVMLHELGHGLGFLGNSFANGNSGGFSNATIYSYHIHNAGGQMLTDTNLFANSSEELFAQFTSNNLFFKRIDGDIISVLYAPNPYDPGSSISHLDENLYPSGNENSLMSPFLDDPIHDPGPLAKLMFAEIGWVFTFIDHNAIGDTESLVDPFTVTITSDTTLVTDQLLLHYSTDNFASEKTVLLVATVNPNEFEAFIPETINEKTVQYYFTAEDGVGRTNKFPFGAPTERFEFFAGADVIAPAIVHNPIAFAIATEENLSIEAEVTDNIGVAEVMVTYTLNDQPQTPIMLVQDGQNPNLYTGLLNLANIQANQGDIIKYEIRARDVSSNQNEKVVPGTGSFELEVKTFETLDQYENDFNTATLDFSGNGYSIETLDGFIDPAIQSIHPYEDATAAGINFIYQLQNPITVKSQDAIITFDEVAMVEPGETGSTFGNDNFNDYVVVEASKDGGSTWSSLLDGYDASADDLWLSQYNSAITDGSSTAKGSRTLFKPREINILDTFTAGDEILIRFRLFANGTNHGWGWAIDNLSIQSKVTGIPDFIAEKSDLRVFPNPNKGNFIVDGKFIKNVSSIVVSIHNLQGKEIYHTDFKNRDFIREEIELNDIGAGFYIININLDGTNLVKKLIMQE